MFWRLDEKAQLDLAKNVYAKFGVENGISSLHQSENIDDLMEKIIAYNFTSDPLEEEFIEYKRGYITQDETTVISEKVEADLTLMEQKGVFQTNAPLKVYMQVLLTGHYQREVFRLKCVQDHQWQDDFDFSIADIRLWRKQSLTNDGSPSDVTQDIGK